MKAGRPAKLTKTATSYIYHPTNIPSWEYTPSPPHTRPPPLDRQQLSTPQATVNTIRDRKAQQAPAGARQTRSMTRQNEVESESEGEGLDAVNSLSFTRARSSFYDDSSSPYSLHLLLLDYDGGVYRLPLLQAFPVKICLPV